MPNFYSYTSSNSHWSVSLDAQFRSQASPYGICGVQSDTETVLASSKLVKIPLPV